MEQTKMRDLRVIGIPIMAALIFGLMAACGSPRTDDSRTVRVGYVPVTTALPLFVAIESGLFEEAGLTVEVTRFDSANLAVEALAAGRIDATSVVADLPWLALSQRAPDTFRFYATSVLDTDIRMDAILASPGSGVATIADLNGRTLATFPGSQLRSFAEVILSRSGVSPSSVQLVEMAPGNQLAALSSGAVDAIFCLEPICTIAEEQFGAIPIIQSPISAVLGEGEPISAANFGIAVAFLESHPDTAEAFIGVMWDAIARINSDQQIYRHLYPSFAPVGEALASRIPVTRFETSVDLDPELIRREVAILTAAGLLTSEIDVERLLYIPEN
jgi:NitT/TauT family transport system substrate-binding protein